MDPRRNSVVLVIPLGSAQVEAAEELYQRSLKGWRLADSALSQLKNCFPGFDQTSVLLKAVAVNTLYGTNVLAIQRMAEHIVGVFAKPDATAAGSELVEQIGTLGKRKHISFGSKFLHFFVDCERFPVFDSYATEMVEVHLGRSNSAHDVEHPYLAFVQNLEKLTSLAGLMCRNQELDRYLWLAGQYRAFKRNPETKINKETQRLFSDPTHEERQLLAALTP